MYKQLTSEQRYAIKLGLQAKMTLTAIAQQICVSVSTVSREIKRNKNRNGGYSWKLAHEMALERREVVVHNRLTPRPILQRALKKLVEEDWSPEQISGYLALEGISISHETIYRAIRRDTSGELAKHCRHKMKYRRHKKKKRITKPTAILNRVSIHQRPKEADGKRFGDWEMDLILGKQQKSAIVTLCERSTNFLIMQRLPYLKDSNMLAKQVIDILLPYKKHVLTITTDNGAEFAKHEQIARKLGADIYFTDSYAAWQKGAIENTNKLIRQYLPKGMDFNTVSDDYIKYVQYKINQRPRLKLNFSSPKKAFFDHFY